MAAEAEGRWAWHLNGVPQAGIVEVDVTAGEVCIACVDERGKMRCDEQGYLVFERRRGRVEWRPRETMTTEGPLVDQPTIVR